MLLETALSQVEDWDVVVKSDSLLESLRRGGASTKDTTAAIPTYTEEALLKSADASR